MTTSDAVAREVVVHGVVQGVGFRAYCRREAQRKGLAGWVTNEIDGSVRAWFEGAEDDVEALLDWCRHGPPGAVVERVDGSAREPSGLTRFDVR
jgi:acylphosphatase